jgi:hypothetical protein
MLSLEMCDLDKAKLREFAGGSIPHLPSTGYADNSVEFKWLPDGSLLLTFEIPGSTALPGDMTLGAFRLTVPRDTANAFLSRLLSSTPSTDLQESCGCLCCATADTADHRRVADSPMCQSPCARSCASDEDE